MEGRYRGGEGIGGKGRKERKVKEAEEGREVRTVRDGRGVESGGATVGEGRTGKQRRG